MECYTPIGAYKKPGGGISFTAVGDFQENYFDLPCGQCIGCRLESSRQWAVRMVHESQMHEQNSFLTLTYDPAHLPTNNTLVKSHWTLFAKRLRKSHGPFRFYHCGEYGDKHHRAHLHSAIFGLNFSDDRVFKEDSKSSGGEDNPLYTSQRLTDLWGKGSVTIGELTFKSASYIAQYVTKKLNASDKLSLIGKQIEPYATMSRRPGIGRPWYDKYKTDVFPNDEVVMRGKQMKPPKYYDNLFTETNPEEMEKIKAARLAAAEQKPKNSPKRKRTIERVKNANTKHFTRDVF